MFDLTTMRKALPLFLLLPLLTLIMDDRHRDGRLVNSRQGQKETTMNRQTINQRADANEFGRGSSHAGGFVWALYHIIFAGLKGMTGSIALGLRIFTATAEKFGPPRA